MPLPVVLGAAAIGSGLVGAKKSYDAYKGSKKAESLNEKAQEIVDEASASLDEAREETGELLEELGRQKVECWDEDIGRFVDTFEQLKRVELEGSAHLEQFDIDVIEDSLSQMAEISYEFKEFVTGAAGSIGSGAFTAVAAYGTAMKVGTATTGTAIGSLSGAAATNATLAWFGGGSLASGGLGVAGGTAVLGGLVAGPALAVGGMVISSQMEKKVAEAKKNLSKAEKAVAKMKTAKSGLAGVQRVVKLVDNTLEKSRRHLYHKVLELEEVIGHKGTDYRDFDRGEREVVHETVMWAQLVKKLLEIPLLTEEGSLSGAHKEPVEAVQNALGGN